MDKDKGLKIIALFLTIILIVLSSYRIYECVIKKNDNIEDKENDNNVNGEINNSDKEEGNNKKIKILAYEINIRKYADENSQDIGNVHFDEEYEVLDIVDTDNYTWYKINKNGVIGYVANQKGENWLEYSDNNLENIADSEIEKLFNYVKGKNLPETINEITLISSLSDDERLEYLDKYILENKFRDKEYNKILEETIKKEYEFLFGENTYRSFKGFQIYCYNYEYNSDEKAYKNYDPSSKGCGPGASTSGLKWKEIKIDSKVYNDRIEIYSARAYTEDVNLDNPTFNIYYNENAYQASEEPVIRIENNSLTSEILDNDIEKVMLANANKLEQFIYIFKLYESDYYYDSIKKIN